MVLASSSRCPISFSDGECAKLGFTLPERGQYGVGMVFLPMEAAQRRRCEEIFEEIVAEEGQTVLGWRDVPVDNSQIGHRRSAGGTLHPPALHRAWP